MTIARVRTTVEREMDRAGEARKEGNEGMVRVCARRAAGAAAGYWMETHALPGAGADAMSRLNALSLSGSVPAGIREAAGRLCARVTEKFAAPFPVDPLADARTLAEFCLREE
jgi:hypothetical protein